MKLQRSITPIALLFTAVGSIVGSGWLFGPLYAAKLAGPAAILSWLLGGLLMLFVAFTFAELTTTYPKAGGMVHFGHMTHGRGVGFMIGFMIWLSSVVVAPVETLALLQYSGNYIPNLIHESHGHQMLTLMGVAAAAVLMALMVWLNSLGAKFFSKSSTAIVSFKLGVPTLTFIVLFVVDFHSSNFHQHGGFMPFGFKSVIEALPLAGVIFSFIGYSSAIQMAGEAKNPQKAVPMAIIGSVALCIILYMLVQTSFIGAVKPGLLASGWTHLSFGGDAGPFAGILLSIGMVWLVMIIYADAVISPFGTAYIYTASTARVGYALAEDDIFPKRLIKLNQKGVPFKAMMLNYAVGMLLFLPFQQWQTMVEFLVSCFIVAYSVGPIALYVLRNSDKKTKRPFKLPCYKLLSFIGFYVCNLLLYWSGWNTIKHLCYALAIGSVILFIQAIRYRWNNILNSSWWLIPYFAGIAVITYLGGFGGGIDKLTFGVDFVVLAVFSLAIFILAIYPSEMKLQPAMQIATAESYH